jgi:hypothetical protein
MFNVANALIPADVYWTSGSDEGCEKAFGWCTVNRLVTKAQYATGQPDNAAGAEHCLGLNMGASNIELQDENCAKTMPYICEVWKSQRG